MEDLIFEWLKTWQAQIRQQDFAAARSLFSDDVYAFGTYTESMTSCHELETRQWRVIWPMTRNFTFTDIKLVADEDHIGALAVVMAHWHSQGVAEGGETYERHGRASLVLRRTAEGVICIHSHVSMKPGTLAR
jgi:ketosteroid isomerase-like protein